MEPFEITVDGTGLTREQLIREAAAYAAAERTG